MSCGTCLRWRPTNPVANFGFCADQRAIQAPYWREAHPSGWVLTHRAHGARCAAYTPRKSR